jgi:hypothetical protein
MTDKVHLIAYNWAGRRSMLTASMEKAHVASTVGRTIMMKARMLVLLSLALGTPSVALAQELVQLKFSRVVDLTLPIESNMAPIPGLKPYLDNPSRVSVVSSITEAQKEALRAEGMTGILSTETPFSTICPKEDHYCHTLQWPALLPYQQH